MAQLEGMQRLRKLKSPVGFVLVACGFVHLLATRFGSKVTPVSVGSQTCGVLGFASY